MSKKIILVCNECLARNYSYVANQNRSAKLEQRKYCKDCNKHTLHTETR